MKPPAYRLLRIQGALLERGDMRLQHDDRLAPWEIRKHDGAGVVTWILIDGEWRIYRADGGAA